MLLKKPDEQAYPRVDYEFWTQLIIIFIGHLTYF